MLTGTYISRMDVKTIQQYASVCIFRQSNRERIEFFIFFFICVYLDEKKGSKIIGNVYTYTHEMFTKTIRWNLYTLDLKGKWMINIYVREILTFTEIQRAGQRKKNIEEFMKAEITNNVEQV